MLSGAEELILGPNFDLSEGIRGGLRVEPEDKKAQYAQKRCAIEISVGTEPVRNRDAFRYRTDVQSRCL